MSNVLRYTDIATVETLGELLAAVALAIEYSGEDASWNGYDDGSIYIHSKDDNKWSAIHSKD